MEDKQIDLVICTNEFMAFSFSLQLKILIESVCSFTIRARLLDIVMHYRMVTLMFSYLAHI